MGGTPSPPHSQKILQISANPKTRRCRVFSLVVINIIVVLMSVLYYSVQNADVRRQLEQLQKQMSVRQDELIEIQRQHQQMMVCLSPFV